MPTSFEDLSEEEIIEKDDHELAALRTEMAEERSEMADDRTGQAEQRTQWAENRTLLANERNFSAWLRTGMAAIGSGLAVAEFLGDERSLLARGLGVLLVLVGGGVCAIAFWRFIQINDELEAEGMSVTPRWVAALLVGGLGLAGILVMLLIILK
jgi:putative membrane protein